VTLPLGFDKVDHVCVAVRDLAAAARLFIERMGGQFVGGGDNPRLGVRAVQIRFQPGVKIELLQPLSEESGLAHYLDRYGEGFHHMTAYVEDIPATVAALEGAGFEVVDTNLDHPTWQETYLRPKSAFGMLIQLARPRDPWQTPIEEITLEDVVAGRVWTLDNVCSWKDNGKELRPRRE
jgi:methylmalonyl-CoA/ethylmalonyl-CoA epimerase